MARAGLDDLLSAGRLAEARRPAGEASTLPADAFTSPEVYAREVERIFRREWLCAGREDQIPQPGDYLCLDLLDEKLVLVRDRDGRVRALSRVCRHRAAEVVTGAGRTRSFQCPYHAWTYGLDGQLVGAPHMEGATGFERDRCRLPEIHSEVWEGWIFVNLDPAAEVAALGPRLAPLSELLAGYGMADLVAEETAVFDSHFNWKVLVDNFMEAYHHIATHRDTLEPVFPAARSHVPDHRGPYSLLVMPARESAELVDAGAPGPLPRLGSLDDGEAARLLAAVVYPFHLFAPGESSLAWYQILPERHDRFALRIHTCFPRKTLEDPACREAVDGVHAITRYVHGQDVAACEAVWSGLHSPSFESGRLSPLEKAIWQFNQWWIDRMGVAGPD